MKMQLHAFRRRDWLQQYANAKSLQKPLQVFGEFAKTFASFWSIYFILFYFTCASSVTL